MIPKYNLFRILVIKDFVWKTRHILSISSINGISQKPFTFLSDIPFGLFWYLGFPYDVACFVRRNILIYFCGDICDCAAISSSLGVLPNSCCNVSLVLRTQWSKLCTCTDWRLCGSRMVCNGSKHCLLNPSNNNNDHHKGKIGYDRLGDA